MSLRIRSSGRILCAAHSEPEPGDFYLDDHVHEYIGGCYEHDKPKESPYHWYDWGTHEYFIDGGRERTDNAIRLDCTPCIGSHSKPCKEHRKDSSDDRSR